MKRRPVTKLDKRNKTTSKNLTMTKIVTSLSFFGFLDNLEQSGGRIPDTESAEVMFSVTVTFCLKKLKTELKNLYLSCHTIALSNGTFLDKKR